jgi:hypothetical protein|tara:strand:+ start:375 stop:635 length:261 start_codon:yes stop_codon:yes gene_type:complete
MFATLESRQARDYMKDKKCCLCGGEIEIMRTPEGIVYWSEGNNPAPFGKSEDDRCCNDCNDFVVIPARMEQMLSANKEAIDSASKR